MTTSLGDRRREKIDALAARAGQVPDGGGGVSLARSAIRRLRRDPVAIIGAVIIVVFLVVAVLAPWLAPRDPLEQALLSEVRQGSIPGSREGFPLGVDQLGRDVLSRLIHGSRQSLLIGVVSTVLGAVVGMALGVLAGAFGGWVDTVVRCRCSPGCCVVRCSPSGTATTPSRPRRWGSGGPGSGWATCCPTRCPR